MSDDYLWDGSGKPDAEVQRLETVLGRFRHDRPAPQFLERPGFFDRLRLWFALPQLAAVAATILLVAGTWVVVHRSKPSAQLTTKTSVTRTSEAVAPNAAWEVSRLKGTAKLGLGNLGKTGRLALGEWLETDSTSRVRIDVDAIGQVEVEPNTRVRLVETRSDQHRLALARGTIRARIWAPPGDFVVDTPSAVTVDLGCAYTLHVDDMGAGLVRVTMGWVGFEYGGRESFIPAGAMCPTRPGVGPGTPYFRGTSEKFQAALAKLDFEKATPEARATALDVVLHASRKRDALTLWHLLSRVNDTERRHVYDRLAALVPPPKGVTREGVLRLEKPMLDLWWNQLGLGDTSWWRMWERTWPPQAK
jgi:translation initiation factor IF-1